MSNYQSDTDKSDYVTESSSNSGSESSADYSSEEEEECKENIEDFYTSVRSFDKLQELSWKKNYAKDENRKRRSN